MARDWFEEQQPPPPAQDWFSVNAPRAAAPVSTDDWFAAHAPRSTYDTDRDPAAAVRPADPDPRTRPVSAPRVDEPAAPATIRPVEAFSKATGISRAPERGPLDILGNIGRATAAGALRFNTGFWGALQAAGDSLGLESVSEFARQAGDEAREMAADVRGPQAGASPNEQALYSGFESMGLSVPSLAAGAATGSPATSLGIMGAATGGESYAQARDKGTPVVESLAYAVSQGAIEVATERIPASRLLADLAKRTNLVSTVTRQLAAEIPGEQVATILQDLNDWATLNPEKPFASYLEERPSAAKHTLIATLVATVGQSTALAAADRLTRPPAPQAAPPDVPPPSPAATPPPAPVAASPGPSSPVSPPDAPSPVAAGGPPVSPAGPEFAPVEQPPTAPPPTSIELHHGGVRDDGWWTTDQDAAAEYAGLDTDGRVVTRAFTFQNPASDDDVVRVATELGIAQPNRSPYEFVQEEAFGTDAQRVKQRLLAQGFDAIHLTGDFAPSGRSIDSWFPLNAESVKASKYPTQPGGDVIDRVQEKIAKGETLGTPGLRKAFKEKQRVEGEREKAAQRTEDEERFYQWALKKARGEKVAPIPPVVPQNRLELLAQAKADAGVNVPPATAPVTEPGETTSSVPTSKKPPRAKRTEPDAASESVDESPRVQRGEITREAAFLLRWMADDLRAVPFQKGGSTAKSRRDAYEQAQAGDTAAKHGVVFNPHVAGTPLQETFKALGVGASRPQIADYIHRYLTNPSTAPSRAVEVAKRLVRVYEEAWDGQRFNFRNVRDETLNAAGVKIADLRAPVTMPNVDTQPRDLSARFLPELVDMHTQETEARAREDRGRIATALADMHEARVEQGLGTTSADESFDPEALEGDESTEAVAQRALTVARTQTDRLLAEYRRVFGDVLNGDNYSELIDEYSASPDARAQYGPAVRPAAVELREEDFRRRLAEPIPDGRKPLVVMTSGGTGSGKSTTAAEAADGQQHFIYDSTLTNVEDAVAHIEQAISAGHGVIVQHVRREPILSWLGTLERAMDVGEGRTVAAINHANTHRQSQETFLRLVDRYAENPRVRFTVRENTPAGFVRRSVDWLRQQAYADPDVLTPELIRIANEEHAAGRTSDAVHQAALRGDRRGRGDVRTGIGGRLPEADQGRTPEAPVDTLDTGEAQPRLPDTNESRRVGKADVTFKAPQQASGDDFTLAGEETPEAKAAREAATAPALFDAEKTWDDALNALSEIEAAAKARLKKRGTFKGGRVLAGLPVDDITDLVIIGAVKIAKGTVQFAQWSVEMTREFGDAIRPHLQTVFDRAKLKAAELGPRPLMAESGRAIPDQQPLPADRILEFPSLQKMPEAIRGDIADLLQQYHGFETQRRGVQPHVRTQELAKDLWLPLETLKPGTALNAEELEAYKTALATALTERQAVLEKIKDGTATDWDRLQFSHLTDVATILTASYRGAKAEAGRALNILRVKARVLDLQESRFLEAALKAPGFQQDVKQVAKAALEAAGDPLKQLQLLRQRSRGNWFDLVQAAYYTNLLSGLKTHLRNTIGNSFNVFANTIAPVGSAAVDAIRARRSGAPRTVFIGEVREHLVGGFIGLHVGLKNAAFTFREGFRPSTVEAAAGGVFDTPRVELPGGRWTNWPGRALEAADEFFRAIAYHQELYAGVYAQARSEGLRKPDEIHARMAAILTDVDRVATDGKVYDTISERASRFAARAVFQEEPGAIVNWLLKAKAPTSPTPLRAAALFIAPFIKTPSAILRQGAEWSPLGVVMKGAKQEGREGAQALGRAALGSALLGPIAWLAATGLLTGAPPDDEGEREEFYAQGKLANAVRLGDYWVRYSLFQPFSVPMAAVANAWDKFRDSAQDEKAAEEAFASALAGAGASLMDQSFLSGLGTFIDAINEPKRYAGRWLSLFVQGLVPFSGLMRNVTQSVDPVYRKPEGVKESVQAIIPGASSSLPARRTRFGDVATRPGSWATRGFVVPEVSKAVEDETTKTLARLNVRPTTPDAKFTVGGKPVTLTREQKDIVIEALGRERRYAVDRLVRMPGFTRRPDEAQRAALQKAINDATDVVRPKVLRMLQLRQTLSVTRLVSPRVRARVEREREAFLGTEAPDAMAR